MRRRGFIIMIAFCFFAVFFNGKRLSAQSYKDYSASLGIFQSPKGIGLSSDLFLSKDHFDTFSLTVDLQGIISGISSTPGIRFTYNYNIPFKEITTEHGDPVYFYAGPGVSFGYVRDTNSRIGLMGGVSVDTGCMILLSSRISLVFEFSAEIGFHLREDSRVGINDFKFYEAGVTRIYYPHIKFQYFW